MEFEFKLRIEDIPEGTDIDELKDKIEFVLNEFLYGSPCSKKAFMEKNVIDMPETEIKTNDGRKRLILCNNCKEDFCSECADVYYTCQRCGSYFCHGCRSVIKYRKAKDLLLCDECENEKV